jgi:mannose-6-phosphate isomerase-like protein (cupin superfamily)
VVKIGETTIGRYAFEPGLAMVESVKPIAKTDSCQAHHVGYVLSGRLHVKTDDGGETEIGPGEAYEVQPGHDALGRRRRGREVGRVLGVRRGTPRRAD